MSEQIFIENQWEDAESVGEFHAVDPSTGQAFGPTFAVSAWSDVDAALAHAFRGEVFAPAADRAAFLENYAGRIDAEADVLAALASKESGLPAEGRFRNTEIPRTTNQLRQAAAAVRTRDWQMATIDSKLNIRSCLGPIGPVAVFGPVNFPFAYNAIAGGDFASAIAAGNEVIARGHPSHPQTTLALMKLLIQASNDVGLDRVPCQLLFGFSNEDGLRLARDRRLAAIGFTGSRHGGLALKASADSVGIPFYGELSSINPVVIAPEAIEERLDAIVDQFTSSLLLAGGQMCTNPGLIFLIDSEPTTRFIERVVEKLTSTPPTVLLNESIVKGLEANVSRVETAGAKRLCGGKRVEGTSFRFENTALRVSDAQFSKTPGIFQTEMFGPACLLVVCSSIATLTPIVGRLDGNLCGSLYLAANQTTTPEAIALSSLLRSRVGRLLNDKMPTGVAVTSAMNHGGPYPSTGHAGFTAVGFPASIRRFTKLDCFDNVRQELLPPVLKDANPEGAWRRIDGEWTRNPVGH